MADLLIEDKVIGTGRQAQPGLRLFVDYRGRLEDGTVFDASFSVQNGLVTYKGQPFSFTLGAGQVIEGWEAGLEGMREGGTRVLTIPAALGYGDRAVGKIPPNSTLVFEVSLLSVESYASLSLPDSQPATAFFGLANQNPGWGLSLGSSPAVELFGQRDPAVFTPGANPAPPADALSSASTTANLVLQGLTGNDNLRGGPLTDLLFGGLGDDRLHGGKGKDLLLGAVGEDSLQGEEGDDVGDGGEGDRDRALFRGIAADYSLNTFSSGVASTFYELSDRVANRDGRDTFINVERFQFADRVLSAEQLQARLANPVKPPQLSEFKLPSPALRLEVGKAVSLSGIRDYDGNVQGGDTTSGVANAYIYQGSLDVQGDGIKEAIFTNAISRRWVTAYVDAVTGLIDYGDHGLAGRTRVVGIYLDSLVREGEENVANPGYLLNGQKAPERGGALDSQRRFQNDLKIDNLRARVNGDFDSDGFEEVYFKLNDNTAYLRAVMWGDGNIKYANYQSQQQMSDYLNGQGFGAVVNQVV
ncbi:MAG: FKBP-type peptidyl-prolyl cis-trans isomerase [Cyanobacteriota bacterium]